MEYGRLSFSDKLTDGFSAVSGRFGTSRTVVDEQLTDIENGGVLMSDMEFYLVECVERT
jgi:hypothetical protein